MASEKYIFHYMPFRARGEFIRYIFAYANVPYEEKIYTLEEWYAGKKNEMPFGIVPVLELQNGTKLSQSLAIGRYLATKYGLTSKDALENAIGDQVVGAIEDLYLPYIRPWAVAFLHKDEKSDELWQTAEKSGIIPLFDRLEKLLGDKKWFCGQNVHWSDLYLAELVDRLETAQNKKDLVSKYPKLLAHCRRVHENPNIRKYAQSRPQYPF